MYAECVEDAGELKQDGAGGVKRGIPNRSVRPSKTEENTQKPEIPNKNRLPSPLGL